MHVRVEELCTDFARPCPTGLLATLDGIESVGEFLRVIALDSNCSGKRAEDIFVALQAIEHVSEIEARLPAEFVARTPVDVDAIDTRRHRPVAAEVFLLHVGK